MSKVRCRVMTFNVRYDTVADGENAWSRRRQLVASVVRYHAPDVVGLQEPLQHQYAYLREQLPEYAWEGAGRDDGRSAGEHCPLGWKTARVERAGHGTVWLSESPERPGSSYPTASKPRLVTWGRLTVDGEPLLVCNTHFDHESAQARVRSARQLRRLVGELGDAGSESTPAVPIVVLGDFNCTPGSRPYRILTGEDEADEWGPRLTDAMSVAEHPHHGLTVTFERFSGAPDEKIDHVFVAGDLDVRQHAVVVDHWDGQPPSDHCPVVAELVLGE
jgi:endonuclease/exonuclease/phosphatase family metal-dependent hydrolase